MVANVTTTAPQQEMVKARPDTRLVTYFKSPAILEKFHNVLGNEANAYIQSVLIACSANQDLMQCEPESVLRAALRAASLELSCDPALKQAYLVPIKGKAEFWPHYRGLFNLAMRTGKYSAINVTPVREGQQVFQHNVSGLHYLVIRDGLMVDNDRLSKLFAQGYHDVTNGSGKERIVGYLAYFKTTRGFEKTIYMSVEEITEHARIYAPNFSNPRSLWNDPKHVATMQMKTVLRELLRWADLSGKENSKLRGAMEVENETPEFAEDGDILDAVSNPAPEPEPEPKPGDGVIKDSPVQKVIREYSYLCIRADAAGVPHEPLAENVTIDQARTQHKELLGFIKGAEAQAKSDQPELVEEPA